MNRKEIGSVFDRSNRNAMNDNFEYLFEGSRKINELNYRADIILNEAKKTNDMNKDVQKQIDELIIHAGESDAEVIQARGGLPLLKDRLDNQDDTIINAQRYANINLEDLWQPKKQPDIHSYFKSGDAFARHIYQEWLDFYEDLHSEFGGYITKDTKPNVFNGRYEYPIYTFTPESGYSKTLILGSGMHGGEKIMVVNLYKFLYHLCNDWRSDSHLSYIRNNIRLVVIPFENPYGIAYNTRKQYNPVEKIGTDINRNFDYKWEESTATNADSGNYKGTAPFSTPEATYIKEVLEQYSDAEAYIDFHNKTPVSTGGGFAVTSYIPEIQPFEEEYFRKLNDAITPNGEEYELLSFDEPSGFNYAANRFKMHALNPEFTPGHMFSAYSSEEMTYALKWLGNIIIRFALLNNRPKKGESLENSDGGDSYAIVTSLNRSTANAYPIHNGNGISEHNYRKIVQLNTIPNPTAVTQGYYKMTYSVTYSSDDPNAIVWFTPKVYQMGNSSGDFSENTPLLTYIRKFEVYGKPGSDRGQLIFHAYLPFDPEKGRMRSEIYAYTSSGTASVLKFKSFVEFNPTNNPNSLAFTTV